MSDTNITFGWVIYPVPRGQTAEESSTPQSAGRALFQSNESYILAMQPHFNTVWVEDHFQWDNRPVLEAMTTLTYHKKSVRAMAAHPTEYSFATAGADNIKK